ncbi:MAG: sigma-54-dependent Fis family transcriptional regulator [Myxococcales bacterium]|nr:sigma-54-dependent Fis family transcriptional regulator [Myxococcales bacterium]
MPSDDDRYPPLGSTDDESSTLHVRAEEGAGEHRFALRVVEGPDRGANADVAPDLPPLLVGTSPACALRLSDRRVSRRHISLVVEGDGLLVEDAGSTNGTWLGATRLRSAVATGGERLRLGETTLLVERSSQKSAPLSSASRFGQTLGQSRAMQRLYPLLERIASSDVPLIIEGETGTGKEVLAESIHQASRRADGPFVVFDCTAVPPSLLESELFGHERGAFTGAVAARRGVFEQAHGGTLLIDEIGDLELSMQPKLLRAIQKGELRRVGSERLLKVDVRVIAATRRDLDLAVEEGRFRDDLFHRLAVARVELPPLRRREGDVALLARQFAVELGAEPGSLPAALLAAWEKQPWPGNVRELHNVVARHLALGDLAQVSFEEDGAGAPAGDWLQAILARELPLVLAREEVVAFFERAYLRRALDATGGSVVHAARKAGVARRYFQLLKAKRFQNEG